MPEQKWSEFLAVRIFLVQKYPLEAAKHYICTIWPLHKQSSILRGILDVKRGRDLKLRQLFLPVICSLKSLSAGIQQPLNRDSSQCPDCPFILSADLSFNLVWKHTWSYLSPSTSTAKVLLSSFRVPAHQGSKGTVGQCSAQVGIWHHWLLLEGSCARRPWWPPILDAWREKAALKESKGQSQVWDAEMESRDLCEDQAVAVVS